MQDSIESKVTEFLVETLRIRHREVVPNATLFGDLGVDGDDAADLFSKFAEEFRVDISRLELSSHFGTEGMTLREGAFFPFIIVCQLVRAMVSRKTPEESARLVPITVNDLFVAARTGQWDGVQTRELGRPGE